METKKSEKANLENKRSIYFQFGIIIALGLAFAAFEWESPAKTRVATGGTIWDLIPTDTVINTVQKEEKITPPKPILSYELNLVDDDKLIKDGPDVFEIIDQEIPTDYVFNPGTSKDLAPEEDAGDNNGIPFIIVEKMPVFEGGEAEMYKFLKENLEYPQIAKETGIQGVVYTTFVVEKDGSISNIKLLRGIGGGCDEEALRVISLMPKWTPGLQRMKPVRVAFNMPISFKLGN